MMICQGCDTEIEQGSECDMCKKTERSMTKIEAKIVKHSIDPRGNELITYELVFPRFLLAELNTHRMFSKNSASSRAIPFKKMVEMVQSDPFISSAWQKEHKGMQGSEYIVEDWRIKQIKDEWLHARNNAIETAQSLNTHHVTKQLCNRLLEPFMWHKVLLTTGKEGLINFFDLRCPQYYFKYTQGVNNEDGVKTYWKSKKDWLKFKESISKRADCYVNNPTPTNDLEWLSINKGQAEIHMMELAESMYDTYNENVPQKLQEGQWHIPYKELIDMTSTEADFLKHLDKGLTDEELSMGYVKASTGLCARTSYLTVGDDKNPSLETLIGIHDKMKDSVPFHASPFEHCSRVMSYEEYNIYWRSHGSRYKNKADIQKVEGGWCRNYKGFIQYRHILEESLEK